MRPVISIVGKSNSGKTTLLEGLIAELKRRKYKVIAIKHAGEGFELDREGTDSWRLYQAGSEVVAVSSPNKLAVIRPLDHDFSPQEVSRFIKGDYDLVLAEGFKESSNLKIEIHSKGQELLTPKKLLFAVVADEPVAVDVPQFTKDEIPAIAGLIERWLESQKKEEEIELFVNGSQLPLNPFVRQWLASVVMAMALNLKGAERIDNLDISLRRKS